MTPGVMSESYFGSPAEKEVATAGNGELWLDKAALASQVKKSPVQGQEAEGITLRHLIEAIRALLRRIVSFFTGRPEASSGPSAEGQADPIKGGGYDDAPPLMATESPEGFQVKGPQEILDRVQTMVSGLVESATGQNLSASLRAALSTPELADPKIALRVLLQSNCDLDRQMNGVVSDLESRILVHISPAAARLDINAEDALTVFASDIRRGGGTLAREFDPQGEMTPYVVELDRLDSALAAQRRAREQICATALEAGYSEAELAGLLDKYGVGQDALRNALALKHQATKELPDNVVELKPFRQLRPLSEPPAAVQDVLSKLEAAGHLPPAEKAGIERVAAQHVALVGNDDLFETEMQADDLSGFGKGSRPTT
ncbi:hypothetical protein Tamer19_42510 [Cupriavidus sp. TA19]|uniref:hypothetical protein n=1 Tax=unclassified Cupriavidus TaxID=2640874 RepID=UPI000E2E9C74|nr:MULTISPECIES: hypothetical protein [unclassified Cupriavidus]BDB30481.1 hypothetical protein CTP10_R78980 [Cupriavidus sp. P-10]GLC94843.1 hypothetical protein Tamer19_42510 [Cupriavidus sp. TA19]